MDPRRSTAGTSRLLHWLGAFLTIVLPALCVFGFPATVSGALLNTVDVSPDFGYGATTGDLAGRTPTVLFDPTNDSVLYATSEWAGVWKSVDGGHTWTQASRGLRNPLTTEYAYPNLAIDATSPQRLLYATQSKDGRGNASCPGCVYGGLWVTYDGATDWYHVSLCSSLGMADFVSSVVFSTGRPFVNTACGTWSTADPFLADGTWSLLPSAAPTNAGAILGAATDGRGALFSCQGRRVYRSLDLGLGWDAGVDLGGTCTGLDVAPPSILLQAPPSTSVTIHLNADGTAFEVSQVDHDAMTRTDLNFPDFHNCCGRSGVWVSPPYLGQGGGIGGGPTTKYDIYAADNFSFYHYLGAGHWTDALPLHPDTWWMAFPQSYDPPRSVCPAFAANDGGIVANISQSCNLDGWGGASAGYHTVFSQTVSGLSHPSTPWNEFLCQLGNGGQPCPLIFLPSADTDTFLLRPRFDCIFTPEPNNQDCFGISDVTYQWYNFQDGLGDSGEVLVDPAIKRLALAIRNGHYAMFIGPGGGPPYFNTPGYFTTGIGGDDSDPAERSGEAIDFTTGISGPTEQGVKVVQTVSNEAPLPQGDYVAVRSPYRGDVNQCQESRNCSGDFIARNVSAGSGDEETAEAGWVDVSPAAHFGPGQIAGVYPSGGHASTTIYVLTSNDPGVLNNGSAFYQPGKVWKGQSIGQQPIKAWAPASGSGANLLYDAYNIFVNPYDPSELYAVDLGDPVPAIKVSHDGGGSWTPVPDLKDIATNHGEFDFACGGFLNGPYYGDKEIFGNECSLASMTFVPDDPKVRVAVLYPGGIAFSRDSGKSWIPLDVTHAQASQQPIELPQTAFYDPTLNYAGNSSLYVSLEGKGLKRIDAPFKSLGGLKLALCPSCRPIIQGANVAPGANAVPNGMSVQVISLGTSVALHRDADGVFRGTVLFDTAKTKTVTYQIVADGRPGPLLTHALTASELAGGLATLTDSPRGPVATEAGLSP